MAKLTREQVAAINAKKSNAVTRELTGGIRRKGKDLDTLDISTNKDNSYKEFPKKDFKLWVVKHPEGSDKVPGSDTVVRSQHYGQAVDDFIMDWNSRKRLNMTIGYPVVQGKNV